MVRAFATRLEPAVLSLGSSRKLWEDADLVPDSVVLYGNLPSKSFYSDADMPVEEVRRRSGSWSRPCATAATPTSWASECDVLHVPGASETIWRKVEAMRDVARRDRT